MNRARLDPAVAGLIRALRRRDGGMLVLLDAISTPWASATFSGARHRLTLGCGGPDGVARAARLAAEVGEMEFAIPGHLVADVGEVILFGDAFGFSALTVVDG